MLTELQIYGLGTALPDHAIEQQDAAEMAATFCSAEGTKTALVKKLYRRSGVSTRYSTLLESSTNGAPARQSFFYPLRTADSGGPSTQERMQIYETKAPLLALQSSRRALAEAGVTPQEVNHLITVSCTGFSSPGVDFHLCEQLALTPGVQRTHVGFMGCHAALNALRVANAITASDPKSCVLVCAVELCSLHYQYGWHAEQMVANALFADGAAAVVGKPSSDGHAGWASVVDTASWRIANSDDLMSWRIGDHGFQMTLSNQVPDVIREELSTWIAHWLAGNGLTTSEVDAWAIHPGGPRILDACQDALSLSDELLRPSRNVLSRCGNMSSPTVLFILDEIRQQVRGGHCVLLAFGPGLTVEAILLRL